MKGCCYCWPCVDNGQFHNTCPWRAFCSVMLSRIGTYSLTICCGYVIADAHVMPRQQPSRVFLVDFGGVLNAHGGRFALGFGVMPTVPMWALPRSRLIQAHNRVLDALRAATLFSAREQCLGQFILRKSIRGEHYFSILGDKKLPELTSCITPFI